MPDHKYIDINLFEYLFSFLDIRVALEKYKRLIFFSLCSKNNYWTRFLWVKSQREINLKEKNAIGIRIEQQENLKRLLQ